LWKVFDLKGSGWGTPLFVPKKSLRERLLETPSETGMVLYYLCIEREDSERLGRVEEKADAAMVIMEMTRRTQRKSERRAVR
jgi:hypothetical protein